MADYQAARDEHVMPMYEFTAEFATLEPPPPELQQILQAAHGNQDAMDDFARVNAGVTLSPEFFSEETSTHPRGRPLMSRPAMGAAGSLIGPGGEMANSPTRDVSSTGPHENVKGPPI